MASLVLLWFLSIESHFVGFHGPYELHRKEEQIEWTAYTMRIDSKVIFHDYERGLRSTFT